MYLASPEEGRNAAIARNKIFSRKFLPFASLSDKYALHVSCGGSDFSGVANLNHRLRADGMKAQAKTGIQPWKKRAVRAEIIGSGLIFATHTHTHTHTH
jgi:hypothetical protein